MSKLIIQFRQIFSSFFNLLWIIICSPFDRIARFRLGEVYQTLNYPFFGDRSILLSKILNNSDLLISIAPVKANEHNVSEFELLALCALIKDNNAAQIFEIGTYDGRTTRAMAMNIDNAGHIYTLNLPPDTDAVELDTSKVDVNLSKKVISGERFINTPQQKQITQVWGDSAKFDFSDYLNKMDFIFIDGAHSEPYVASDTINAMKLIKNEGGFIVWHDAHLFGVKDFFKRFKFKDSVFFIRNTSLAVMKMKNGSPVNAVITR